MPLDSSGPISSHTDAIARDDIVALRAENARLRYQNRRLAEEVKELVKTENRLYRFQAKLDTQVQHYQQLYKLSKTFHQTFELDAALALTAQSLVYDYHFERCLILLPDSDTLPLFQVLNSSPQHLALESFKVCAFEGYYEDEWIRALEQLRLPNDRDLFLKLTSTDVVLFHDSSDDHQLASWGQSIGMDEYIILFLKNDSQHPIGLVVVGNTRHMRQYHSRVTDDPDELLGLANLGSQLVAAITNINFYQALQEQQTLLERKVEVRTQALNAKNTFLETTLHTLQQTQAQLIQSEKMSSLGQLVAGVAHEINNPINFIDGNLQYLQGIMDSLLQLLRLYKRSTPQPDEAIAQLLTALDLDFLEEDLPHSIGSMQTGVERIQEIVSSLRNFSRMDEASKKRVDIHEGIESTLMILEHRLNAQTHCSEIRVVKDYSEVPPVECYVGQLNQVLMNLLTNAIDACEERYAHGSDRNALPPMSSDTSATEQNASPQGPCITIRTGLEQDSFTISITDNGTGIEEAVQSQMFNPFFTTKPVGKGTGMGLSISYQIITERHGGQLTCQSVMGVGTTFTIAIPMGC